MKKFLLIAAIAAGTGATAQVNFGAQVGGNLANVKSEATESGVTVEDKSKSKIGFIIGVVAELPLASSLSFRPELNFIQKGAKSDVNDSETSGGFTSTSVSTGKTTLSFIELPLNIVYSVPAGNGTVFFGAGPSIGYGIGGKYDFDNTATVTGPGFPTQTVTSSGKGDIKFDGKKDDELPSSDNDGHLKALDFGGNILAGYKMPNGIFVNLGYTLGFSNLAPNANSSYKTNGLSLKVGFMFGGNKSND